jgi:hypothetical protein
MPSPRAYTDTQYIVSPRTNTWPAEFDEWVNGVPADAANLDVPIEQLVNAAGYLKTQTDRLNYLRPAYSIIGAGMATPLSSQFSVNVNQTSWLTTSFSVSVNADLGHAVQLYDILEFTFGPFLIECASGDTVGLRVTVAQSGYTLVYPVEVIGGTSITATPVTFSVTQTSSGGGDMVIGMQASNKGGAYTSVIQSTQGPEGGYGWGSNITTPISIFKYLQYKLLRVVI